jgi:outer membrane protein
MMKFKLPLRSAAVAAAMLVSTCAAAQEIIPIAPPQDTNYVGAAVFGVPDYYGSSKYQATGAAVIRYGFEGQRYIQLLGPELTLNAIDRSDFRAGPVLRVRDRRDNDVDDQVVRLMRPVPSASELGLFAAYHLPLDNNPLHKVVFSADIVGNVNGVYNGPTGNLRVNYIHPFAQTVAGRSLIGTVGVGLFFASREFNERYFGVTGSDVALFPSRGGVEYRPGGGLTSVKIPFSVTTELNPKWLLTLAGRYERLVRDAKDSPVVNDRGDANQWSLGLAAAYKF